MTGIEFEYRYLFDEFKDELFRKNSRDPYEFDSYRDKVKTVDDYIKYEKNSIEKWSERIDKTDRLKILKDKIEEWYEYVDDVSNEELINKAYEFKKYLFAYIELHLDTYKRTQFNSLIDYCKFEISNFTDTLQYIEEDNKENFSKKVKDELNSISMEIFNKFNKIKKLQT